jgi:hypothetical protein
VVPDDPRAEAETINRALASTGVFETGATGLEPATSGVTGRRSGMGDPALSDAFSLREVVGVAARGCDSSISLSIEEVPR